MENSNIRTFLRGKKKLSVNILNKELLDSKVFNDRNQWDISIIQNGIFIDLSQCEWVDFIAISQLVLIVESALKFNIDVKIALPYPSLTDSQINKIEITQDEILLATFNKNADKRKKVLIYLDILGFKKVILCSHIHSGSIQIIENFQFVSPLKVKKIDKDFLNRFKANTSIDQKIYFNRIKSKCIIPLQWVSFSIKENHYTKILEQLKSVLSNNEKGIEEIDADTFSKIILYELVKNVHDHSKSAYGLVGIVTQNVKAITSDSYYNSESKFYEFFEKTYANYISIFFSLS